MKVPGRRGARCLEQSNEGAAPPSTASAGPSWALGHQGAPSCGHGDHAAHLPGRSRDSSKEGTRVAGQEVEPNLQVSPRGLHIRISVGESPEHRKKEIYSSSYQPPSPTGVSNPLSQALLPQKGWHYSRTDTCDRPRLPAAGLSVQICFPT